MAKSIEDPLSGAQWKTIGDFGVDAGTVGFGDASAMDLSADELLAFDRKIPGNALAMDFTPFGVPLIAVTTMEDAEYPVEVIRSRRVTKAARVCFTNDVDELEQAGEGLWKPAGEVVITSGSCVVGDPFCRGAVYQVFFPLKPGTYAVEVFVWKPGTRNADRLGIRLRLLSPVGNRSTG
jgi:hypothetical protein